MDGEGGSVRLWVVEMRQCAFVKRGAPWGEWAPAPPSFAGCIGSYRPAAWQRARELRANERSRPPIREYRVKPWVREGR